MSRRTSTSLVDEASRFSAVDRIAVSAVKAISISLLRVSSSSLLGQYHIEKKEFAPKSGTAY